MYRLVSRVSVRRIRINIQPIVFNRGANSKVSSMADEMEWC